MLWSWLLAVIGVFGLYLTTRKMAAGFAVGVGVQALWITYAIVTAQYGFIFSALAFGTVNALGFYKWKKEPKPVETIVMKSAPIVLPETPNQTRMEVPFFPPSEYDSHGMAKWNVYPFVRQHAGKVIIGPTSDKQYILNNTESYRAGQALIEASKAAEDHINRSWKQK